MKIVLHFDPKPIPDRHFDWSAVDEDYDGGEQDQEGNWHGGDPVGYGRTAQEAVKDLLWHLDLEEDFGPGELEKFDEPGNYTLEWKPLQ